MVSLLSSLVVNDYSVRDTFGFVKEIVSLENNNYVMASFDIKSLFTNIPVSETCEIILEKLFPLSDSLHMGFDR